MTQEEISYKDLSKWELEKLKDFYVTSRLTDMSETDLRLFVKLVIEDQIKGTVGNEEEREAWNEMKDYFQEDFQDKIKGIQSQSIGKDKDSSDFEKSELDIRKEVLEKRKQEKDHENKDMW